MTVKELREACRKYALKVSGNKDVLVVRLAAFLITMTKAQREEAKGKIFIIEYVLFLSISLMNTVWWWIVMVSDPHPLHAPMMEGDWAAQTNLQYPYLQAANSLANSAQQASYMQNLPHGISVSSQPFLQYMPLQPQLQPSNAMDFLAPQPTQFLQYQGQPAQYPFGHHN